MGRMRHREPSFSASRLLEFDDEDDVNITKARSHPLVAALSAPVAGDEPASAATHVPMGRARRRIQARSDERPGSLRGARLVLRALRTNA